MSYLLLFLLLLLYRQAEAKILKGPHEDLESYLAAIDQLRNNLRFFTSNKSFKSTDEVLDHANSLLAKSISKLEEEFKQILLSYRSVCIFIDAYFDARTSFMFMCSALPSSFVRETCFLFRQKPSFDSIICTVFHHSKLFNNCVCMDNSPFAGLLLNYCLQEAWMGLLTSFSPVPLQCLLLLSLDVMVLKYELLQKDQLLFLFHFRPLFELLFIASPSSA